MDALRTYIRHLIREQLEDDERIPVEPFDQTRGLCGPASLKMILRYFDDDRTEEELARAAGSSKDDGTPAENLVTVARELGYDAWVEEDTSMDDLRHYVVDLELPVMVNWFSTTDGHYSVVTGIDDDAGEISLQDPEIRRTRTMPIEEFEHVWFDYTGDRPEEENFVVRRIIVVSPMKSRT